MNSHEAVTLISEACNWIRHGGDIYTRGGISTTGNFPVMAHKGHLTAEGKDAALVMAMGRDDWDVFMDDYHIVIHTCPQDHTRLADRDWPEGKPMDSDTIRDCISEALKLEVGGES